MIKLNYVHMWFDDNRKKRVYYLIYTFLFFALILVSFSWFFAAGKSLIWETDGWNQHFKAYVYYGDYLKKIVRSIVFDHKLVIPEWDFYIGEGSDIVNVFHYYVMGDPIALFAVLVPRRFMHYFFSAACILRLYLAGVAFSVLCFGTGKKNRYSIMAGALSYCFCIWGLYLVTRHPYFVNPMTYFPLMILGVEKIIRNEKPYLYIFTTAVSAASNFYFFYMIVLGTVGYSLVRIGMKHRADVRKTLRDLIRLGGYAFIGVMMAGIIFFPVLMIMLKDSRLSVAQPFHLFYPPKYYSQLPGIVLSNKGRYWLHIGFTAPVILSVFLLFAGKRKNTLLKVLFGICVLIILFPIGGRIFNGMSYMTNRWCWIFSLLCSYILVSEWDALLSVTSEEWKRLLVFTVLCYVICLFFESSRSAAAFSSLPMLFLSLLVTGDQQISLNLNKEIRPLFLLFIVMAGVMNTAFWHFSPGTDDNISEFKENNRIWEEWKNNEAVAVRSIASEDYPRYSGHSLTHNISEFEDVSSTQYSWSLSNPYVNRYRSQLEMRESSYFSFLGYDDRTTPIALAAVGYFTVKEGDYKYIPYGFEKDCVVNVNSALPLRVKELCQELKTDGLTDAQGKKLEAELKNNIAIFRNRYALPLGYCYDSVISSEAWEKMNPVQKQESLLESAYPDEEISPELKTADAPEADYLIPFEVRCIGSEITQTDSGFVTTEDNAEIELILSEEIVDSEVYVGLEGIEFTATPLYDLYFGDESLDPRNLYNRTNWDVLSHNAHISIRKEKIFWNPVVNAIISIESSAGQKKMISYKQPDESMSSGRHDFIANLGYMEKPVSSIKVTLPTRGVYSFDSIRVYSIPMKGYGEKVEKLRKNCLKNVKLGVNSISGTVKTDAPKLLCIAIPYSEGWRAVVDGKETKVHLINEHYLGLYVAEGKHSVFLHYQMPYKKEGAVISALGFLSLTAVCLFERKLRRHCLPG